MDLQKNARRFTGFSALYDGVRPVLPAYALACIRRYLGREPEQVVDLGCGTGLSTLALAAVGGQVTGVEPSGDMLRIARSKAAPENVTFREGFAHDTGLPDAFADVVVCSQSFHWMEPQSTLAEVNRILKPGGVFATIDFDWPPVCDWRAESAYCELMSKVHHIESEHARIRESFRRWDKNEHLSNIKNSGYFRYCREIVFLNQEKGDANRFIGLALSQGGLQTILKTQPSLIEADIELFEKKIQAIFNNREFMIGFCYRMRVGIK